MPAAPSLDDGVEGLRIARLGGYFARSGDAGRFEAVDRVAAALGAGGRSSFQTQKERARPPTSSPWSRAARCI